MDMPPTGERLLTIGEFSRLSRISIRMLRHYDDHGVLRPTRTDPCSGYRFYAPTLLATARRVRELRDVGLGVGDLAACAAVLDDVAAMRAVLTRQRARLLADAAAAADRVREVDHLITELEKTAMSIDVTHRTIPARRVASLRGTIPGYDHEGELWQRLGAGLAATGAQVAPDAIAVAVFHDESFVETDADVEVQLDVRAPFAEAADLRYVEVPAQDVVVATLQGGYEGVSGALESLGRWAGEHGYAFAGPMFNIYRVGPGENPDPAAWVTDVCAPVAPVAD